MADSMKDIWEYLSSVDVTSLVKPNKTGKTVYLPWSQAHKILMDKYNSEYRWSYDKSEAGTEFFEYPDGTGEVRCTITICGHTYTASTVVTESNDEEYDKYEPVTNPNASQIHNAKMRARVRCAAECFGLGFDLWIDPEKYKSALHPSKNTDKSDGTKQNAQKKKTTEAKKPDVTLSSLFATVAKIKTKQAAEVRFEQFLKHLESVGREAEFDAAKEMWEEHKKKKGWQRDPFDLEAQEGADEQQHAPG
tara:strand:- start:430 stop:1176 length:747 start_codon:yes stop_codon:yes gene_type:complete